VIVLAAAVGPGLAGFWGLDSDADASVHVGAILPLSGKNARYGELERQGLELALSEINAGGGINGKPLGVDFEDSAADPKQALSAWQKIRLESNAPLVISGLSNICMALSASADADQTVLLATDCSTASYSSPDDYSYRIVSSNAFEGAEMADYLVSIGVDSVAVLQINNDYGLGYFPAFRKRFLERGGIILIQETYAPEQRDFRSELSKVVQADSEALLLISYAPDAELILKQRTEFGILLPVFAAEPIENAEFLKNAGRDAEGIRFFKAGLSTPKGLDFVEKVKRLLGKEPETNIARAYDALWVAATVLRKCDANESDSGACVKGKLDRLSGFEGVLGAVDFDDNGDVHIPYVLKTVRNGKFVLYEGN